MTITGIIKPLCDISGNIISLEASLPFLHVQNPNQPSIKTVVQNILIDTGFNGALLLPHTSIKKLKLPPLSPTSMNLADGTEVTSDVFEGRVYWDGSSKTIEILEIDAEPLLGMMLLQGYKLEIETIQNGKVNITKLP